MTAPDDVATAWQHVRATAAALIPHAGQRAALLIEVRLLVRAAELAAERAERDRCRQPPGGAR